MSSQEAGGCLHERFEAQVTRTPDAVAVECDGVRLTYRELNRRASDVAERLGPSIQEPGQLVGLCLGRSVDLIVGLLAIVKAGGAYVPIDPSYPAERIRLLLEDSRVSTVVTRQADAERLPGSQARVLVDAGGAAGGAAVSLRKVTPADAAYVIYTSGSTGTPKGTVVEHRNVVRLFDATEEWFRFSSSDVWTLYHSVSFDFSVWEIWGALLYGGRLVIVPSEVTVSPVAFARFVAEAGVTVLNQTPTAFGQFARAAIGGAHSYPALRVVIFGGERLDAAHLRPWIERYGSEQPKLVNMYGITETTVHVTYRPMSAADLEHPGRSPIGRPIPDLQLHLLDEKGAEPAPGAPGEIVVTGAGVSRGYLGRPELTAERFPMLPLGPGGALVRSYRSGDLACRVDGELIYFGRADDQVKVRGYRIELREIELRLEQCPGVDSCAVIAHDFGEGDTRLLAFVVPNGACGQLTERVAEFAARALPGFMCPSRVIEVEETPRTAHGKRDKEALLRRYEESSRQAGSGSAAATPGEQSVTGSATAVAQLARSILRRDLAMDVDLFDQGATSLSVARLLLDVNALFKLSLTGAELDGDSSINGIGAVVDRMLAARDSQKVAHTL
jgi:amino acid adenylation domain-containing protein